MIQQGCSNFTCIYCGTPIATGAQFCSNCAKPVIHKRFCGSCGVELKSGKTYCDQCGTKVGVPAQETQQQKSVQIGTFCQLCNVPIAPGEQLCKNCAKPATQKKFCGSCGMELISGKAFCNQCGVKVDIPVPVSMPHPPSPPPQTALSPTHPSPPKTPSGLPLVKIIIAAVVIFGIIVIAAVVFLGTTGDSPAHTQSVAVQALSSGDWASFSSTLSAKEKLKYGSNNSFSTAEEKVLADAIQKAVIIDTEKKFVWYETTVNGHKYMFLMTKEAGKWKIEGL